MSEVVVSLATSHNKFAVVFDEGGTEQCHYVDKFKDSNNVYQCMLNAFMASLRYVRQYLSDHKEVSDVVFVVSNSIFIKWVKNQYSKPEYQQDFVKMMRLLNELPIEYDIVYEEKTRATHLLGVDFNKNGLSGLDFEEV